jgi:predicted dehydrogenase
MALPGAGVRAGLIGGGFIAGVHVAGIRATGAEVVAIASSSADRARVAADELAIPEAAASAAALIEDPRLDVVHICSPHATHAGFARAALVAGRHVVCEKPLAADPADAGELAALAAVAARSGRVAAVPFVYRYHPMVREARSLVAAGTLGPLITIGGAYLQDWRLTVPADGWWSDAAVTGPSRAFADIGSHLVDLLEFVGSDPVVAVDAATRTLRASSPTGRPVTTEDVAIALIRLRSGAIGTLAVSQMAHGHANGLTLELSGELASLAFDQERPEELVLGGERTVVLGRRRELLAPDAARLSRTPAGHPLGYLDAFRAFIADVYAAVAGVPAPGLPAFADAARAARITGAVLASASGSGWVDLEEEEAA